jgi:hypothetical protein
MPGIHRIAPRRYVVWAVAAVTVIVVLSGFAILRQRFGARPPAALGNFDTTVPSTTPPVLFFPSSSSSLFPSPSASASPSPSASGSPKASSFWGDIAGIPAAKNVLTVKVLNRTNGTYPDSRVYWTFNGRTQSIADQPYLDMPVNAFGRMYFHLGSPDSKYSDFIEFTVGAHQFTGNTTRVDAFVLKLAIQLHAADGYEVSVGEDQRTFAESRAATFQRFRTAVPAEFRHLAQGQDRIGAPGGDPEFKAGGQYADYFHSDLATSDIFRCAGALAGDPGECATLNRHGTSYATAPANFYAKFWHDSAIDHLAYGFPYDNVGARSTSISHANPKYLLVAVGF